MASLSQVFTVGTGYPLQVNASAGNPQLLLNKAGGTVYYNSERTVSSSTKEGELAESAKVVLTQPTYVIATASTQVEVSQYYPGAALEAPTNPPGFYAGNWTPNTAESGTDTTPAEKKLFVSSIFLPVSKRIKGIGYLVGSVGGTNKVVAGLWDINGTLLAHSSETTEGATVGTAKEKQELELTAPYFAYGPATYFIGITMNGNTARLRTIPKNTIGENLLSKEISITSKNVLANITAPTAVEADKGMVGWVY